MPVSRKPLYDRPAFHISIMELVSKVILRGLSSWVSGDRLATHPNDPYLEKDTHRENEEGRNLLPACSPARVYRHFLPTETLLQRDAPPQAIMIRTDQEYERALQPAEGLREGLRHEVRLNERMKRGELRKLRDLTAIGRWLIGARIARGWTVAELADRLNVSPEQLSREERGRVPRPLRDAGQGRGTFERSAFLRNSGLTRKAM